MREDQEGDQASQESQPEQAAATTGPQSLDKKARPKKGTATSLSVGKTTKEASAPRRERASVPELTPPKSATANAARPASAAKSVSTAAPVHSHDALPRASALASKLPTAPRIRKKLLEKLEHIERELFHPDRHGKSDKVLKPYDIELTPKQHDWLERCFQNPRAKVDQWKQKLMDELLPKLTQRTRDEVTREEMKE